jgi:glycosyltransferase involved in cell wall biosynthesis
LKQFQYGLGGLPLISVITPTRRYGPVYEILFSGLKRQTFKDWELILVDDVPEDRSRLAGELAERSRLSLKWTRSKPNRWKSNRLIANARNTGLIHAEGEVVVFIDDYTWVPPGFLEAHYKLWEREGYSLIGSVTAVKYTPNPPEDLSTLPVYTYDERTKKAFKGDEYIKALQSGFPTPGAIDTRRLLGYTEWRDCPPGWFYCSNTSAPLQKIIEVNGFDEEMDCTSEEDVDLGLRLARVGCRFWFKSDKDANNFHMTHGLPELNPPPRYKPEECHYVTKGMYNELEGSHAIIKRNRAREPWKVNEGIFDLREARLRA